MKYLIIAAVLFLSVQAVADDADFIEQFVQGKYVIIGKYLESDETYQGHITISETPDGLAASRAIDGQVSFGQARVESALSGDANVLRLRFDDIAQPTEQTCLVSSDLDNYARVTCYVYRTDERTVRPGYEAWFNDHTAK